MYASELSHDIADAISNQFGCKIENYEQNLLASSSRLSGKDLYRVLMMLEERYKVRCPASLIRIHGFHNVKEISTVFMHALRLRQRQ